MSTGVGSGGGEEQSTSASQAVPADSDTGGENSDAEQTVSPLLQSASTFPVDVVFSFVVHASKIHFVTQERNQTAADCILGLPELTLVVTSRRSELTARPDPKADHSASTHKKQSRSGGALETLAGGICVSACLSKFLLSIYSPLGSEEKSAVRVEIDTVTISLIRGTNQVSIGVGEPASGKNSGRLKNSVKFSVLADVDGALFKYDMRRLRELLSFPKAWYRKAIMRRLFFGDPAATSEQQTGRPTRLANQRSPTPARRADWEAAVMLAFVCRELNVQAHMSNAMGNTSWLTKEVRGVFIEKKKILFFLYINPPFRPKTLGFPLTIYGKPLQQSLPLPAGSPPTVPGTLEEKTGYV
jgi:hypothetical protein